MGYQQSLPVTVIVITTINQSPPFPSHPHNHSNNSQVRVFKYLPPTQQTIRMHYANCNSYNADFDGDEMNCHLPMSLLAKSESQQIVHNPHQYIVPTDGSPVRGLIQVGNLVVVVVME
jgi:DNA-directed RNA polymerase beta' subunit